MMLRSGYLLAALSTVPLASPTSAEPPVRVTTESTNYCTELATRFSGQASGATEEARALAAEGRMLCETGHVRTGIAKLRRALRAAQAIGG